METPKQAGGREDCWSEESTAVLIEAWGERYLRSSRGNLRQNDWNEVADAVNSAGNCLRRTDVQCKNRIDTIKKKYKIEKAKSPPSTWRFFHRLDFLIGNANAVNLSATVNPKLNSIPRLRSNSGESTQSGGNTEGEDAEVEEIESESAVKELAAAMVKFGEIYERIESWKQEKFMELERQRIELAKELELQRMNMFVDAQLQLEKSKHSNKKSASAGKKL